MNREIFLTLTFLATFTNGFFNKYEVNIPLTEEEAREGIYICSTKDRERSAWAEALANIDIHAHALMTNLLLLHRSFTVVEKDDNYTKEA